MNDVLLDNCKVIDEGLWIPKESIRRLGQYYMDTYAESGEKLTKQSYTIDDLNALAELPAVQEKYKYLFQFVYELYKMYTDLSANNDSNIK